MLNVDNVEEVGITTDTRVAGMDVGQLGLPSAITDLLNAANSYGTYQVNVMLNESLSSTQIETARQALEMPSPALRTAPPPSRSAGCRS